MGIKQTLEKKLTKFGQNNSPTIIAMGIAIAKGIFRPTFTMMDKSESYETKRYTALREGMTEATAIPIYYLSGVVSKAVTKKLAVPKNFMPKELYKKYKAGDASKEVMSAYNHAEQLAKTSFSKIGANTSFIGVCLSALILIPFTCSITIKPIMKRLEKSGGKGSIESNDEVNIKPKVSGKTDINGGLNNNDKTLKSLYTNNNYGMRVGGL